MHNLLRDTVEAYYWAGMLLADGASSKPQHIRLQLSEKDKDHLVKYGNYIGKNDIKESYTKSSTSSKKYKSYYINLFDKDVVLQFKQKFEWINQKSYNPPSKHILENMDNDLFLAFLVGFIDGDGSIRIHTNRTDPIISIGMHSSWLDFLNDINNRLNTIFKYTQIKPAYILSNSGYARYEIGCMRTIRSLKQFIIDHNLPILSRKWDRVDINRLHKYEKRDMLIQQAKQLKQEGLTLKQIAKKLNVNFNTLNWHFYNKGKLVKR